jgi:7-cyano-7-deazaguanine reductase
MPVTTPPSPAPDPARLATFPNPAPERDYLITMRIPEFTSLCPLTGQPDFAVLELAYVPDRLCLELKALKIYVWSYRDARAFHEAVTNAFLDDLVRACAPRYMRLKARFHVRGGIWTAVTAAHRQSGWDNPDLVREASAVRPEDTAAAS